MVAVNHVFVILAVAILMQPLLTIVVFVLDMYHQIVLDVSTFVVNIDVNFAVQKRRIVFSSSREKSM